MRDGLFTGKRFILIIMIFLSCKMFSQQIDCDENLEFKEIFLRNVKYIEDNIYVSQDSTFRKSVVFIWNYAPLSVEDIMNYARIYPVGVFEQDRVKWLDWYEENKCQNIQLKKMLVIPGCYQD